ncbi:MAG: hypothetical protein ABSC51_10715 [Gaiellaceae bacterium]|jgi:hypothetical protein
MSARIRVAAAVLLLGGLLALLAIAGISPSAASQRRISSGMGKIHAHLTKTSFTPAKARTVKLVYSFSPASSSFGYRLSIRRGAKWLRLRSVKRSGRFVGSHALTVKALFGTRAVNAGSYRLGLNADVNSLLIAFRVVGSAPVVTARSDRPSKTVKLIFVHHSTGENWLADDNGELGIALKNNNYFVSDTNYGWGPNGIGDKTDIGDWWLWFRGASSGTYLHALYTEFNQHASYSRIARDPDPSRENEVIMFKSCFPNSQISGHPNDAPASGSNPLRGQDAGSSYMTVANVKGIYNDLLTYFATHQNKLFVLIVSPPLAKTDTDASHAANARAVANWLVKDWPSHYNHNNVAVFDFYNVLTSNGGSPNTNDLGKPKGNHHRVVNGAVQHVTTVANNFSAYPTGDSHPSRAGNLKATGEFVPLLNYYYHLWANSK